MMDTCGQGLGQCKRSSIGGCLALLGALVCLSIASSSAWAIPAFARQMGVECTTCHTAYPQLNAFGREFKLTGYTLSSGDVPWYKKLALMTEPSFTHTSADLSDPPDSFGANNNLALTQTSLFFGGRIAGKAGAFVQGTYDGVGKVLSWDNTDLRLAGSTTLMGKAISSVPHTTCAGWMRMSQLGRSGLRCSRASTVCMALLETETPFS